MIDIDIYTLNWSKMSGLIPVIIQDKESSKVLMLGYMNQAALQKTLETREVTFYSRSKKRLWTKGETSGNKLKVIDIFSDCDKDSLLIWVKPQGPVCHTGRSNCFGENNQTDWSFIQQLVLLINKRCKESFSESYIYSLFQAGLKKLAQKVGEEGVETALAALENDPQALCEEAADLFFHLLILLAYKQLDITNVIQVLRLRRDKKS